jgi:hypothetical protein
VKRPRPLKNLRRGVRVTDADLVKTVVRVPEGLAEFGAAGVRKSFKPEAVVPETNFGAKFCSFSCLTKVMPVYLVVKRAS